MKARFVYESLYFERGQDPKTSMRIGKAANALKIFSVDKEMWDGGVVYDINSLPKEHQANTWDEPMYDEAEIHHLLDNWEEEIGKEYTFWVEVNGEGPEAAEYRPPNELEGNFVEFQGEVYQIPETDLFKNASQQPA